MIEESFVSFDTAKLLKEAGFDVPCRGVYVTDRTGYYEFREYDNKQTKDDLCWNTEDGFQYEYLAPTQALAERWLREVYGLHIFTKIDTVSQTSKYVWYFWIQRVSSATTVDVSPGFNSSEQAMEAGLKEALEIIKGM